jgi:dCTP deaminase
MAFWSSQQIKKTQEDSPLILSGYDKDRVKCGAYELSLSREVLTTPDGSKDGPDPGEGPSLRIPPGQFAILYTKETVVIPNNVIGFISIKFTAKSKGLVNISGFHVDPGYRGRLKYSVYNAGNNPIHLDYDKPLFLLWFADLDDKTEDPYHGDHNGQKGITSADRDQMAEGSHSPAALNQRLEKLEYRFELLITIGITAIVVPLLIALFMYAVEHKSSPEAQKPSPQPQTNSYLPSPLKSSDSQIPQGHEQLPPAASKSQTNASIAPKAISSPRD